VLIVYGLTEFVMVRKTSPFERLCLVQRTDNYIDVVHGSNGSLQDSYYPA
jgi:hypothetical protein